MKERCLKYEKGFRKYLFSFNYETHKKILENIGLKKKEELKEVEK